MGVFFPVSEQEVGMSSAENGDEMILEGLDLSLRKFSVVIVRYDDLVGSVGVFKDSFKSLDTLLSRIWNFS